MSRRKTPALIGLIGLAAVGLLGVAVSGVAEGADLALYLLLGAAVVLGAAFRGARIRGAYIFATPQGLVLTYLAVAVCVVPVLWMLELAEPWASWVDNQYAVTLGLAFIGFSAIALGMAVFPAPLAAKETDTDTISDPRLRAILWFGLGSCVVGFLAIASAAGGPVALVRNLATRRELLAGTGPLRVLLLFAAVACVVGVLKRNKSRGVQLLTWLNGIAYVVATLATGSRFQAILLVVACWAALARQNALRSRQIALTVTALVPASVIYLYEVRQELSLGRSQGEVSLESPVAFLRSTISPFVGGALDTLRTVQPVARNAPVLEFRLESAVGSLLGPLPRSVFPGKPDGSSLDFSREYFAASWARGTGIPPSVVAEAVYFFGLVGGILALVLIGAVTAAIASRLLKSSSLPSGLLLAFLTADSVLFAKAGLDSLVKTLVPQLVAILVISLMSRSGALHAGSDEAAPSGRRDQLVQC